MNRFCRYQLVENPVICDKKIIGCPYTQNEIYQDNGKLAIAHKDEEGKLVEHCNDFSPWRYKL